MLIPSKSTAIIAGLIAFLFSMIFWLPVDHQAMHVQGFFWKETIEVTSSPVIQGEGNVLPKGAVELSREQRFDKSSCQSREDDCTGVPYTWYKYTLSFTETIDSLSSHGYDQNPVPPSTLFLSNGEVKENSETLYMAVYLVDARGDLFVWNPRNLEDFQEYDIKTSYVGTYNLIGWLLSVK